MSDETSIDSRNQEEVEGRLREGMTVKDLMEMLEGHDPQDIVCFQRSSGDYRNTVLCTPVSHAEPLEVVWSGYHSELSLMRDCAGDDDDGSAEFSAMVLVLE